MHAGHSPFASVISHGKGTQPLHYKSKLYASFISVRGRYIVRGFRIRAVLADPSSFGGMSPSIRQSSFASCSRTPPLFAQLLPSQFIREALEAA